MQVYKAIKYIRLSYTDDKTVESDSVANQRRLIDDYIARHPEIEVVAEKIDDGYSGVLFDRPAFQEMMRMIEQGEANCVIVKDLSRLGREYIETGRYMRRVFPAYGVRFIAINDNVDTENDAATTITITIAPSMMYIGQTGNLVTRLLTPTSINNPVVRIFIAPSITSAILYSLSLFSSVTATGKFHIDGTFSIRESKSKMTAATITSIQRIPLPP